MTLTVAKERNEANVFITAVVRMYLLGNVMCKKLLWRYEGVQGAIKYISHTLLSVE